MKNVNISPALEAAIITLAASINGKKGGSARSEKKTRAVRKNGRLGGRPRKTIAA